MGNKTPEEVYQGASGGGALIVDKYGAKEGLPVALRSSGTAFTKDSLEKTLGIEFKNRGTAEELNWYRFCLALGVLFSCSQRLLCHWLNLSPCNSASRTSIAKSKVDVIYKRMLVKM